MKNRLCVFGLSVAAIAVALTSFAVPTRAGQPLIMEDLTTVAVAIHVGATPVPSPTSGVSGGVTAGFHIVPAHTTRYISTDQRFIDISAAPGSSTNVTCAYKLTALGSAFPRDAAWTLKGGISNDLATSNSSFSRFIKYRIYDASNAAKGPFQGFIKLAQRLNQVIELSPKRGTMTMCIDLQVTVPPAIAGGTQYATITHSIWSSAVLASSTPSPTPAPSATPKPTATPSPTPTPMPLYPATILADKPVTYYHMDETPAMPSFTLHDVSGNGNDATANASSCLGFQSTGGAILGYNDPALQYGFSGCANPTVSYRGFTTTGYSVEAWFLSAGATHSFMIYRGSYGACRSSLVVSVNDASLQNIGVASSNKLAVALGDYQFSGSFSDTATVGVLSSANVLDGKWHHIVATWSAPSGATVDPSQLRVYVDGLDTTTAPFSSGSSTVSSPIYFNGFDLSSGLCENTGSASGPYFDMGGSGGGFALDEFALYDYALTATQALDHYHAAGY